MADHSHSTEVDPQALAESKRFWGFFMCATKYSVIAIVILLALMAVFLV